MEIKNRALIPDRSNAPETGQSGKTEQPKQVLPAAVSGGLAETRDSVETESTNLLNRLLFSESIRNTPLSQVDNDDVSFEESDPAYRAYFDEHGAWDYDKMENDIVQIATLRRAIEEASSQGSNRHRAGEIYSDQQAAIMAYIPPDVFRRAALLADMDHTELMTSVYGEHGLSGELGTTPSSDFSSDGTAPHEQHDPIAQSGHRRRRGGRHLGGPVLGPQPGQGGTLTGSHGRQGGHGHTVSRGRSQKADGGYGYDEWGEGGGVSGSHESSSGDAFESSAVTSATSEGGQTVGPYSHESTSKYGVYEGNEENASDSQTGGGSATEKKKDKTSGDGLGPSESTGDVKVIPMTGLPPADETGQSEGGDDAGGGTVGKYRLRGVSEQEKDLVGPAFEKTTGPDDEETPSTGGTSGTVATNTSESRADDVGGQGVARKTDAGTIDAEAGEELLEALGLREKLQPGGPDPEK